MRSPDALTLLKGACSVRRFSLIAVLMACVFALPSLASAYVPSITNVTKKPLRWVNTNCVQLIPDLNGSDDIPDDSDIEALTNAVNNWHDGIQSCSYIRFQLMAGRTGLSKSFNEQGSNEAIVTWVEKDWSPTRDVQAAGLTTLFFVDDADSPRDGMILDADVELNGVNFRFSTGSTGKPGRMDLENTLTHELGHVLGLDHPCDDGTRKVLPPDNEGNTLPKCGTAAVTRAMKDVTMYNFASTAEIKKRTLEPDDVLGICETYPLASDPGQCSPPIAGAGGGCSIVNASKPDSPTGLFWALLIGFVGVFAGSRQSCS
jgi:hypothetical protein